MEKGKKTTYKINPAYTGMIVSTIPPIYGREDGGKFVLNKDLSQIDLGYLFEVIHHEAVEVVE